MKKILSFICCGLFVAGRLIAHEVEDSGAKFIQEFTLKAINGSPKERLELSKLYHYGQKGVKKSVPLAIHWALAAAEAGNLEAGYQLGILFNITGVYCDSSKSDYWIKWSADRGYAPSQVRLGFRYAYFQGGSADLPLSAKWYRMAAEQGDPEGMFQFGACLKHGRGISLDEKVSLEWFKKAAELGNLLALHECGAAYFQGIGVAANDIIAMAYFRLASDSGMSVDYNYPDDISKGRAEDILKILMSRMSQADKDSAIALSLEIKVKIDTYLDGKFPERREQRLSQINDRKEFDRVLALAEKGDADAQHSLYSFYWNGTMGGIQDSKKALYWLNKSAEQGFYLSQLCLGDFYQTGDGVAAPDLPKVFFWYLKAAEQGNAQGMNGLGRLYELGRGVEKDELVAFAYYLLAVLHGYEDAREKVASYEARLSPEVRRLCLIRAANIKAEIEVKLLAKKNKSLGK